MTSSLRSLVLLLIGIVSVHAADTGYQRLYVFGDSYSDIGAGYVDGNGPTAVAYLAWRMGLSVTYPNAKDYTKKSLVYAVSGAQTGEGSGRHVKDSLLGYGMINQVKDFAAKVKAGEIKFDPAATLFFLAGGLNDGRLQTETTVAHLRQEIEMLQGLGARHLTVSLLTTRIPGFGITGRRLNPALTQLVADAHDQLKLDVWLNHWGLDYDEVLDHPAVYGIVNTKDACAGRALMDQDPVPVGDPSTYFFYHAGHPSTAVHRVVGEKLFAELKDHPAGSE